LIAKEGAYREYKNNGQEWTPTKNPTEVNVYDFIDKTNGKASPYGVYDIQNNRGWVNVGTSSDTATFAVSTISDCDTTLSEGKNHDHDTVPLGDG